MSMSDSQYQEFRKTNKPGQAYYIEGGLWREEYCRKYTEVNSDYCTYEYRIFT